VAVGDVAVVVVSLLEGSVVVSLPPAAVSAAMELRGVWMTARKFGVLTACVAGVLFEAARFSGLAAGAVGVNRFCASMACCLLKTPSLTSLAVLPVCCRTFPVFAWVLPAGPDGRNDAPLLMAPRTMAIAATAEITRRLLARKEVTTEFRTRSLITPLLSHTFFVINIADHIM
jgi:hypothetical protein